MPVRSQLRRLIPKPVLERYHWVRSWSAAWWFGLPARHLVVIGVTGTKGKSTTCAMIWHVLRVAGIKTGLISTAQLAVDDKVWLNDLKMTMPGRRTQQRLLRRMVAQGCQAVVLETSSEGLAQWRHAGIPYDVAVFTNLAPEHLEAHGSYERYRAAKGRLFQSLAGRSVRTVALAGRTITLEPTSVVNLDDAEAPFILSFPARRRFGYTVADKLRAGLTEQFAAVPRRSTPAKPLYVLLVGYTPCRLADCSTCQTRWRP